MYGYIPDARGKTDGYQQVYTLPDFRLLFQVSGYGYAVGYTALVGWRKLLVHLLLTKMKKQVMMTK